jgi:hypothetical protein
MMTIPLMDRIARGHGGSNACMHAACSPPSWPAVLAEAVPLWAVVLAWMDTTRLKLLRPAGQH